MKLHQPMRYPVPCDVIHGIHPLRGAILIRWLTRTRTLRTQYASDKKDFLTPQWRWSLYVHDTGYYLRVFFVSLCSFLVVKFRFVSRYFIHQLFFQQFILKLIRFFLLSIPPLLFFVAPIIIMYLRVHLSGVTVPFFKLFVCFVFVTTHTLSISNVLPLLMMVLF